jgi:GDPmannose 4,6-dehydratase
MSYIALITGITGQDGSYLAEFLLEKGYQVWGIIRRSSQINTQRIEPIFEKLNLRYGDITDIASLSGVVEEIYNKNPGFERLEIYNLAAQSHVKVSFEMPIYTANSDAIGTLNLLEIIKNKNDKRIRMYQASTSELYGNSPAPQNELTPFQPRSPYAVAKLYSYWIVKNYRESYNMFACNGILFNHTSPRRGHNFVCKKVVDAVKKIATEFKEEKPIQPLVVGNIYSKRDFGHAKDYVRAMWMMLQQEKADDFVISTGIAYSIKQFIEKVFEHLQLPLEWQGEGVNEVGICRGHEVVKISSKYFRPCEVNYLLGDCSKAREVLGWNPEYNIDAIIQDMIN